jgi:hypothetical protein
MINNEIPIFVAGAPCRHFHRLTISMQMQTTFSNSAAEHDHLTGGVGVPFSKMLRKDKRRLVERFCTVAIPENQNGKTRNLSITCNCCGKRFMGQLLTALVHLAGVSKGGQRMSTCPSPNEEIKAEVLSLFAADEFIDSITAAEVDGQSFDKQYQRKRKPTSKAQRGGKRNRAAGSRRPAVPRY